MNLKKGQSVEILIADLAFGGAGVGKMASDDGTAMDAPEGRSNAVAELPLGLFVVFVEGVIPGDTAEVRVTKIKKQYAEADLVKIIKPSPSRIAPKCKHFGLCGGCSLQFLSYEDQLKWKEKVVKDSLQKIGGFKDVEVSTIIGCKDPQFYRNKMEYSFGTEQLGGPLALGLHPKKNYRAVFNLEECILQSPVSVELVAAGRKWAIDLGISPYDTRTSSGVLKNLIVREGKNTGELMVNLVTNGKDFSQEKAFAEFIKANFQAVTSLYRTAVTIKKGFRTVVEEFHLYGKKNLTETLSVKPKNARDQVTLTFEILPQAFFQPNTKQAEILYEKVLEFAQPTDNDTVLDLFCGTGTIGMFFAKLSSSVIGVELNASAVENAKSNASKNSINNIDFICADVDKFLEKSQLKGDILITDPPRAGIANKSLEKLLKLRTQKWVYVSCNPTTLARDLKIICADGYKLERVQPVDMFPHTYHVETVCLLIKK